MLRAIEHHLASFWPAESAADSLTLDFDNRHRRRIRLVTDDGADVLLDLPKAVAMAHGDGLLLEDGRWLRIDAAPETLVEVRAANGTRLARIAWHIGNRHLPAQILEGAIRIRPDHVIEAMLVGLGGHLTRLDAPFQPEGGAYGGELGQGQAGGHSHTHDAHGHDVHGHDVHGRDTQDHGAHANHAHGHDTHGHGHGPDAHGDGTHGRGHDHGAHSHTRHAHDH